MKPRLILFCAALVAGAWAVQGGLKFERSYKVGEADAYTMALALESDMGPIDVTMKMTQTVKKVHENGDAELETVVSEMHVNAMGNELDPPTPPASVQRINRQGVPVRGLGGTQSGGMRPGMGMMMNFGRFAGVLTQKDLKVGEPVTIDDPEGKTKGTVTLESLSDGVALVVTKLEIKQEGSDKAMKVEAKTWIDAATSKLNKMEGVVSGGLPGQQKMPIQQVKITMTRVTGE